jgi:hypothetical protein
MLGAMETPEKQPATEADKFIVRLPVGMRRRIAEAAKANQRSMNAEIVARLQFSFEASGRPSDLDAFADQLAEKLAKRLKQK